DVKAAVPHEGGGFRDGVEHSLDAGTHRLGRSAAAARSFLRRADQLEEVRSLDVVELKRLADGVEDVLGDPPNAAALQLDVVLDADPGEHGHLIAPQPGHTTAPAISRQPCPLRRDARPAGGQKLADLTCDHASSV